MAHGFTVGGEGRDPPATRPTCVTDRLETIHSILLPELAARIGWEREHGNRWREAPSVNALGEMPRPRAS
jgi:hypothetical protein